MTEKELAIQLFLCDREIELGQFFLQCIRAKQLNRQALIEHRGLVVVESLKMAQMTPEEEEFMGFYQEELKYVEDMDYLTLRAHREKLSRVVRQGRAKLNAADKVLREREAKERVPKIFRDSGATSDELTSNAINVVKKRQSRGDKMLTNLLAAGMTEAEAREVMSAQTLLQKLKGKKPLVIQSNLDKPEVVTSKLAVNPFAKKPETELPQADTLVDQVTIVEEADTIIITQHEQTDNQPKAEFNPFAKK